MATVVGSMDSHLFELRNFQANEVLYRERHHSNKTKAPRGSPPERSRQRGGGATGDPQAAVPLSRRSNRSTTHMAIVASPLKNSTPATTTDGSPRAGIKPTAIAVEKYETDNQDLALALREPMGGEADTFSKVEIYPNDLGRMRAGSERASEHLKEYEGTNDGVLPSLDAATLKRLAKMVAREMQGVKKVKVPIQLDNFTGEKSPYLAEEAIVWLKKLRLAAKHYEWDHALALEVASIHLKGLAARWFASVERHLADELHLDKDRWNYFQAQFEERFADFRSRLLQVEKIKELKLRHGEDIREYAEAIMSMNCRLEDPLDDEFLRWVFIHGLPPSELRDKLYRFEEKPHTLASAVKYARRFQLSQSVFNTRDSPAPRISQGSMSSRSVKSN